MTYEEARNIAKSWCEAWTHRDLDAVMEHYADDVKLCSPMVIKRFGIASGWIEGRQRLREYFSVGMQQAQNLRFDFVDVLLGVGGMAVVYRRETGALVVDVVELDDKRKGRVVRAFYGESSQ